MKEVMAIIRQNMMNETKEALTVIGVNGITASKVMGRGKRTVDTTLINKMEAAGLDIDETIDIVSNTHALRPKRIFTMIVEDALVKKVVDTIINVNKTGNPGDGKIFISDVGETLRIRTGETGDLAI